jgi:hypothetical protein
MFRTTVSVASVIAAVSVAASAFAGPIVGPAAFRPDRPQIDPDRFPGLVQGCPVDPAIASVTLTKGSRPGQVRVSYVVVNNGASAWRSGAGQQVATLNVVNSATGATRAFHRSLPTSAASGATMASVTTPMMAAPFDHGEFGGEVEVSIAYDPDIYIDGNRCNDDGQSANNTARVENSEVLAFLTGAATTRTFTF